MKLWTNPPKMNGPIKAFLALFVLTCFAAVGYCGRASSAEEAQRAASPQFELGYGQTFLRGQTDVAMATVIWPRQIGNMDLFVGTMLIGPYEYYDRHWSNQIGLRAGVTPHLGRLGVTLGVCILQNQDLLNSGLLNFNVALTWKLTDHLVVYLDSHISNAGTHPPNTGRDMFALAWRFK